jgi:hypothetical protein
MTNPDSQIPSAEYDLHITFLFHCAFATQPDGSRTDVLLAPGSVNGAHVMQHIASLRVPAASVERASLPGKEAMTAQKTPAVTRQRTDTLRATENGKPEIASQTDYVFRIEGYDVWIDPPGSAGSRVSGEFPPTTSVRFAASDGADTFVIANIAAIGKSRIDPLCMSDYQFPKALWGGARVRVWGGSLRCEVPEGNLKHRRWEVAGRSVPVGLSDRMDYRKKVSAPVVVRYRRFDAPDPTVFSTAQLMPDEHGVIRVYVTNDPFVEDMPHGPVGVDPCKELPHFASYGLLLEPAGTEKPLKTPPLVTVTTGAGFPIAEGNSFCCPCSGEP